MVKVNREECKKCKTSGTAKACYLNGKPACDIIIKEESILNKIEEKIKIGNIYQIKKGRFITLDFGIYNNVELSDNTSDSCSLTDNTHEEWKLVDIVKNCNESINYLKLEDENKQWVYCDLETFKHFLKI